MPSDTITPDRFSDSTYEKVQIGNSSFIIDSRYKNLQIQGVGSYGTVVSAIDSSLCRTVAIKKIIDPFSHIVSI